MPKRRGGFLTNPERFWVVVLSDPRLGRLQYGGWVADGEYIDWCEQVSEGYDGPRILPALFHMQDSAIEYAKLLNQTPVLGKVKYMHSVMNGKEWRDWWAAHPRLDMTSGSTTL